MAKGFIYSRQTAMFGEPEIIGFGNAAFSVRTMNRHEANAIVRENHYSRTVYNNSLIHLGVYDCDLLRGVLQFGQAMNPQSMGSVVAHTEADEYLELNRMWLQDCLPRNSESRAISYGIKFIRRTRPAVAWIQSFADERCGRFGVVYQACNFDYCGEHTSTFWELDGEMFHNSVMTRHPDQTLKARHLQDNKERAIPHQLRQFRYVYFIKPAFRSRLLLKIQPYPKHASEVSMETRPGSTGEGQGRFLHDALETTACSPDPP